MLQEYCQSKLLRVFKHLFRSYLIDRPAITGYLFIFFCMYGDLLTILSVTSVRSPVPSYGVMPGSLNTGE